MALLATHTSTACGAYPDASSVDSPRAPLYLDACIHVFVRLLQKLLCAQFGFSSNASIWTSESVSGESLVGIVPC